ncbi:MAG: 4Fe-4S dicluster domain-containing protein, partial [Bdellovibrionales bacterium]|nr:4Fe-4S dicluster domain-containing protein [Bdellovibrionales bacterium]
NWGDLEVNKGQYFIQQPTVRPLYNTRSIESAIMNWTYAAERGPRRVLDPDSWHDYLKNRWREYQSKFGLGGDFETFWQNTLQKGFAGRVDKTPSARSFRASALTSLSRAKGADVELVLYAKSSIGDGSLTNNAWLQELPDPISKICWDNYLVVSTSRLHKIGLKKSGELVKVERNGTAIVVPIFEMPGIHDDVVGLAVGYGHAHFGRVANDVGSNAFPLSDRENGKVNFSGLDVKITPVGGFTELANTQGHNSLEGRQIVVEATLEQYLKDPSANIHKHKIFSLWPKHEYKGHRWAMTIDLNACVGCSACSVACQSENNIPTVGKKYVLQGREMHWIRVDRYFSGDAKDPDVVFQPMTCQQCENASCESVCPVAATTHDEEGINQMTYNRCVGTRYCSNNCPYKVRRFNWFNYSEVEKSHALSFNPDVTVRSRGVMEKCTFCTQRIKFAKFEAKREHRDLRDGDVMTACQEACPTNAIVFGDVNDPNSKVSQGFKNERTFAVLEEVNNVPMVRYQTRLRNKEALKSSGHEKGGH